MCWTGSFPANRAGSRPRASRGPSCTSSARGGTTPARMTRPITCCSRCAFSNSMPHFHRPHAASAGAELMLAAATAASGGATHARDLRRIVFMRLNLSCLLPCMCICCADKLSCVRNTMLLSAPGNPDVLGLQERARPPVQHSPARPCQGALAPLEQPLPTLSSAIAFARSSSDAWRDPSCEVVGLLDCRTLRLVWRRQYCTY